MEIIGMFFLVGIILYGFLALVNWSPNLKEWTGFSRFLMGVWGVVFVIRMIDEV
jgi:hypothetical protein